MTDHAIQPFLFTVATPTRPLGDALPSVATPPALSPWSPRPATEAPPPQAGPTSEELAAIAALRDEARDAGRAEGLAETTAVRDRLGALVVQLEEALAAIVAPTAELVAELATCVIETWVGHTHRSALFAPVVRSWLAQATDQPATLRIHPDDEAAAIEAIGDAAIAIATDPALAPGTLELRSATRELGHAWQARLPELRTAIVAALTGVES